MQTGWIWLLLSTLVFIGSFVHTVILLRRDIYHQSWWTFGTMLTGFILQCVYMAYRGQAAGRCPITTEMDVLVFVAWSAVMLYLLLGRPFRLSLLGAFTAPLVAIFQLIALPAMRFAPEYAQVTDYWMEMHASISLLAYGAFALACIAGVMFMVQDRMLHQGNLQALSYNLPPITNLSKAIVRLLSIGVFLLTLGILSGFGTEEPPKALHLIVSFAVWAAYVLLLAFKFSRGIPSLQTARWSVGIFLLPLITVAMMH